jgi:hypothetical protein
MRRLVPCNLLGLSHVSHLAEPLSRKNEEDAREERAPKKLSRLGSFGETGETDGGNVWGCAQQAMARGIGETEVSAPPEP